MADLLSKSNCLQESGELIYGYAFLGSPYKIPASYDLFDKQVKRILYIVKQNNKDTLNPEGGVETTMIIDGPILRQNSHCYITL